MAEFTSIFIQQVESRQNALLTEDAVRSRCVNHRSGSGLVCVANSGTDCNPARYRVYAKANIAIPTGGTVEPISLALALNGEVLQSSLATVTPAAVENFFNVSFEEIICAGKCQVNLAVVNPNTQTIEVEKWTLIGEREC